MFCPNCGHNCGNAKFCMECGTKIQKEQVAFVTQAPTISCPHCGGKDIRGNQCSFCGMTVYGEEQMSCATASAPPEIPYGTYNCEKGALILYEKDFAIERIPFFGKKTTIRIPYHKLTKVVFLRSNTSSRFSVMLFRWEECNHIPIPQNLYSDQYAFSISRKSQDLFYHIFYALKALAPSNASFEYLRQGKTSENVKQLIARYNLPRYFDEFAPYRERATESLCKRAGVSEVDSKFLIDLVFDLRQGMLYKEEPDAAIRDLNLIVTEWNRQTEARAREIAQRNEQNSRDAALAALQQMKRNQNQS